MSNLPKLPYRGVHFRQHRTRGSFFAEFRDRETGRRKQVWLGTDQGQAFLEARELSRRWVAGDYDPWRDRKDEITFKDAVALFLKRCSHEDVRPETIDRRRSVIELFREDVRCSLLCDVSTSDVRAFVGQPHLKGWSRYQYYTVLNRFFNVAVEEGWLSENPAAKLKKPKPPEKRPAFLTKEEYVVLQHHLQHKIDNDGRSKSLTWLRDFIQVAVATGLRRNELRHLRWSDVDLDGGVIHVRQYGTYRTKSGKDRSVPIFPMAREVFERRPQESQLVIPSSKGTLLDGRMISRRFAELRDEVGIRSEIHLHNLRDTFGSWLATEGVNLRLLQQWMGHKSIQTTERYAWLLPTNPGRWAPAFTIPSSNANTFGVRNDSGGLVEADSCQHFANKTASFMPSHATSM